jgi:hypothetical protein
MGSFAFPMPQCGALVKQDAAEKVVLWCLGHYLSANPYRPEPPA